MWIYIVQCMMMFLWYFVKKKMFEERRGIFSVIKIPLLPDKHRMLYLLKQMWYGESCTFKWNRTMVPTYKVDDQQEKFQTSQVEDLPGNSWCSKSSISWWLAWKFPTLQVEYILMTYLGIPDVPIRVHSNMATVLKNNNKYDELLLQDIIKALYSETFAELVLELERREFPGKSSICTRLATSGIFKQVINLYLIWNIKNS
jgi:hypothetical protein